MLSLIFAAVVQTSATAVPQPPQWTAQCLNEITLSASNGNAGLDILDDTAMAAARAKADALWIEANEWMANHQRRRESNDQIVARLWERERTGAVPAGSASVTIQNQEDALDDDFTDQMAAYEDYPSCGLPAPTNVLTHTRARERQALLLR